MKKLFTLFAAAAMTMSVSAEVIYSWESKGADDVSQVGGVATAKVDEARVNYSNEVNGKTYYTICLSGKLGTYPESAYVNVTLDQPLAAGDVISVTAYRNKNATGKNATVAFLFGGDKNNSSELKEQFPNINPEGENDPAPGTQTIVVPESAAGMSSFDMRRVSSGTIIFITNLTITREGGETPAEGEAFTIEGFGANTWGKSFDEYVTPFEFDYDTKVVSFKNFLGGETTVDVKFELTDPNGNPSMVGAVFNSVPVSGLGEGDQNTGCTIDNFAGSLIIKQNGVNYGKLDNIKFWPGYNSQLEVGVEGEGATAVKVYNFTFMLGGDYSQWNAETGSWTAAGSEFVKLMKTLPFNQDTSAIENIEVEAADENAPVEYFNIQGMRVENPAAGQLLIRRQGSKVSKVIIR